VAVVTGASSGIGASIARALAAEGCAVALAARRVDKLAEVEAAINAAGNGKAISVATDVTKRADVRALVKAAEETLGPVDIMVSFALPDFLQAILPLVETMTTL
jgi:NADP-dependent 3-hydroxy acid dehydrogenase YdfG